MKGSQVCSIAYALVSKWCLSLILGAVFCQVTNIVVGAPVDLIRTNQQGRMVSKANFVEYRASGATPIEAATNQVIGFGDALQTHASSRAEVRLTDWTYVKLQEHSLLEIIRDPNEVNDPILRPLRGQSYIATGGNRRKIPVQTTVATGTPQGTEFLVRVDENVTEFIMLDGEVVVTNTTTAESRPVKRFHQARVEPGKPIEVRPILATDRIVQWWIYYPGVVDSAELFANMPEPPELRVSRAAYRAGDLLKALQSHPGYPEFSTPSTDNERAYMAALLLAVGATERAEAHLAASVNTNTPPVRALRLLVQSVAKPLGTNAALPVIFSWPTTNSASECMALSYAHQSTNNLFAALRAARSAAAKSPNFGFAWARIAELEFSSGNTRAARSAIDLALQHSPSNAQAHCVRGFLLAADYKVNEALAAFDTAIEIDPGLGNAWLGRGLCKRRLGIFAPKEQRQASGTNLNSWLSDLQAAAMMEPGRSLTRAYAGKAFSDAGNAHLALKELDYAAKLDPNDPTPPLYKALELHQQNRPNEAVRELERSITLNDNRAVYRSRLLLDQDQATRSTSLAKIYQDAGLEDVALREAARAVSYDYASHSAHQFLAESYNSLRDPTRFNLRYETVWFNELLLANLLSPVGAGLLSQNISQQEYSRLFEANRLGLTTSTEYRSDGQLREIASHYGLVDRLSYTLDLDYQHNSGTRPNNDLDRIEWYSQFKYQLSERDSVFLLTKYQDFESGDNRQMFAPKQVNRDFHYSEQQSPLAAVAYHHEWNPKNHTLLMGGRLENAAQFGDPDRPVLIGELSGTGIGTWHSVNFTNFGLNTAFEVFFGEAQQTLQIRDLRLLFGARAQAGEFRSRSKFSGPDNPTFASLFYPSNGVSTAVSDFERFSGYAYATLPVFETLYLTAGASIDSMRYPCNYSAPPVSDDTCSESELLPKAAIEWHPSRVVTVRGMYAESLGGVSFDESFRLEPSQLAGFAHAFRTVISESEVGSVSAPLYHIGGAGLNFRMGPRTYFDLVGQWIESDVSQNIGALGFNFAGGLTPLSQIQVNERLDYVEKSFGASLTHLIGDEWSVGTDYRLTSSSLIWKYPEEAASIGSGTLNRTEEALLHRWTLNLLFNHSSGFFAAAETQFYWQDNDGYTAPSRSNEFVSQSNVYAGWRFFRRKLECTLGVLNVADEDYQLNSLTPYHELPHERAFLAKVRLMF